MCTLPLLRKRKTNALTHLVIAKFLIPGVTILRVVLIGHAFPYRSVEHYIFDFRFVLCRLLAIVDGGQPMDC